MIGTCRFCGQMKEVRAADQSAADEMTSRSCDCAASGDYARKIATQEAVALSVDDGLAVKASLSMAGLKISVGSKNNGNTYLKIVQSEEENREITRDGVK